MSDRSLKSQSRRDWVLSDGQINASHEQIKLGALLRIADAVEAMAKRHTELMSARDFWEGRAKANSKRLDLELRRTAALRGHLKRTKKAAVAAKAEVKA